MLNVKEAIFDIQALDDGTVAVIDQASTLRKIDVHTFKVVGGFKSKLQHRQKIFNLVATSKSGMYTVIAIPKKGKAALYLSEEKKLIDTIGIHQGEIEAVAFSDSEQYVATGGTDGKSYVYYATSGAMLFSLPSHRDYVSAIAFSPNTHYVATGSFDQTIQVKNIISMSDHFRLIGHSSVIKKLLFLSNDELLSADKDGNLIIWGIKTRQVIKRLPRMLDEITDMTVTEDKRFLFVSTRKGQIALYNLLNAKQLSAKYIQDIVPINALAVVDDLLIYGNDSGDIAKYAVFSDEKELAELIALGSFSQAYTLVHKNPILEFSNAYIDLEKHWNDIFTEARQTLLAGKKAEAEWMLAPFMNVAVKKSAIKHLLEDFVDFGKFKLYIQEQKYSLAYGLASKCPAFEETKEYEELEAQWELAFNKAKKLLLEDTGEEKARNYLVNFRSVPSKSKMINELFQQRKVYALFRKKLAQRDFESIFKLAKSYPFLTSYKEYKDMLTWGDHVFIKIHDLLDHSDFIEASKLAQGIKEFPDFKNEIKSLIEEPEVYVKYEQALKSLKKDRIYAFLSKYPFLAELSATEAFEKSWYRVERNALEYASTGDVLSVLDAFESYLMIPYKKNMIATILKSAMIASIKIAMKKDIEYDKLEKLLRIFVLFFGYDEMIRTLVNDYSFTKGIVMKCDTFARGNIENININKFKEIYLAWK